MSNTLAIAAVTATLRNLLTPALTADVSGTDVTTQPPDQARDGSSGNQVNLFLYQTEPNEAWRNMPIPQQVRSGETGQPPLALDLFYLLTAYGQDDDDILSHQLLGRAMRILHDHPVLSKSVIEAALSGNDLHEQVERIRITPQPMSLDEMSKLWNTFQTPYRISAAYQVAVVLIDSRRPVRTPLPVLRRGADDRGVDTVIGPFPALETIRRPAGERYGVQLGDSIELVGRNLGGDVVAVRFVHPLLDDVQNLTPTPASSETKLVIDLPAPDEGTTVTDWAAGFYRVDVVIGSTSSGPEQATNKLPLALSPIIRNVNPNPVSRDASGNVTLTITCAPEVLPDQHVQLLVGDREIRAVDHPASTDALQFQITDAPTGNFVLRLRLDGVDSLPLKQNERGDPDFDPTVEEGVLIFDPDQKVEIT